MAEDFDIEAMLEAPYNSSSNGISTDRKIELNDEERKHKRSRSRERKERKRSLSRSRSKERRRKRSRTRSKERKRRSRSRERKHRRSKERSRERSIKLEQSRERHRRSRSRDKRGSRERSIKIERSRSRERHRRSRSRDRRRHDDRYSRRYRDDYSPRRSPSYTREEDRILEEADRRTVFCMQLAARVRPRDLEDFFSRAGKVREVRLIMDNKTRKHKGIAYIEFRDSSSVQHALQLNGQKLCGYPVSIQPTHAEKNKSSSSVLSTSSNNNSHHHHHHHSSSTTNPNPNPVINHPIVPKKPKPIFEPLRLYVGSLHFNVTEDMLRSIFEPFGKVIKIELMRDSETLRSKGYGFITFANSADAKKALEQMNGYELAGRPMKVNNVTERGADGSSVTSNGPTLDSEELERSGIDLGTKGRLQLMAKLAEGTGIELPKAIVNALNQYTGNTTKTTTSENGENQSISTPCFMLNNLFDPESEEDEDWPLVIKDEVLSECRLHGGIVHIFVDTASKGNVYIKATSIAAAHKIVNALHGRFFSGKLVTAVYVQASSYHQLFPDSLNAIQPL